MKDQVIHALPIEGGSYTVNPDGSTTLRERTGDRDCACQHPPELAQEEVVAAPAKASVQTHKARSRDK